MTDVWCSVINLPPRSWLITPGNGVISGIECHITQPQCSDWALSGGGSQVSLGEWKSMLLIPCITSTPAPRATFFITSLGNDRGGWGKRPTGIHRINYSSHLRKSSSAEVTLWWAFTWDTNIFTLFTHSERSIHVSLSKTSLSSIF